MLADKSIQTVTIYQHTILYRSSFDVSSNILLFKVINNVLFNVANLLLRLQAAPNCTGFAHKGFNLPNTISPVADAIPNSLYLTLFGSFGSFGKKLCVMNKHFTYPLRQSFAVFLYPFI